jgi:hypothetical protein
MPVGALVAATGAAPEIVTGPVAVSVNADAKAVPPPVLTTDLFKANFAGLLQPPIALPPTASVTTPVPVTAPPSNRPDTELALETVMLVSAITVPMKESPLSVADDPTRQYTLQGFALPVTTELPFIVNELAILKTKMPELSGEESLSVRVVDAPRSAAPDE